MASFTERRSCQISWQHAPLSRYIVQSLPLLNFSKGSLRSAAAPNTTGSFCWALETNNIRSILLNQYVSFFKDVFAAIDREFFILAHLIWLFIPACIPPRVPSSRCRKPFLISQRFSDCWAADTTATINKLKVSLPRGTGSIYRLV